MLIINHLLALKTHVIQGNETQKLKEEKPPWYFCILVSYSRPQRSPIHFLFSIGGTVLFPNHYNRFQMVLENYIDSEHQKKSVIL